MNFMPSLLACSFLTFVSGVSLAHAQSLDAKAREVVSQMTLRDKIEEVHGTRSSAHLRYVLPVPRLHIPGLRIANGPAGVGPADDRPQKPATALPAPISLAATWDVRLAYRYGRIIGREARDLGYGLIEGPDINIARVPQNGRTFEGFGEDPYLVSQAAVNEIRGIQSKGVIADVKHFVANNQETDRHKIDEIVGERALREIYLPAFRASVEEGHVGAVMAAYPKVNGVYCAQNAVLLDQILKKEWGFEGFVTSDFGAVHSTVPSALAGMDLEMPTGKYFGAALESAVESGKVPISVINDKLIRRYRTMMQFGLFKHTMKIRPIPEYRDGKEACRIAEHGIVLLKNSGNILPLDRRHVHSIALIGPYAMAAMTGGGGSSHVIPLFRVSPAEGIRKIVGRRVRVDVSSGRSITEAVAIAKSVNAAVVMVGDSETEGRDHSIILAGNQNRLVEQVAAANPNTIVVLKTGSAVLMPWVNKVRGIVEAWYPGEEDGDAVAAVLFGLVNPSGKLPLSFPARLADLPAHTPEEYPGVDGVVHYKEGIFVGCRYYDEYNIKPLFPFGFGLSYTTFAYSNLNVSPDRISLRGQPVPTISVSLDLSNTGKVAGREVAEVYVGLPSAPGVPQPPKELKAFAKVFLRPGQSKRVHLKLDPGSLRCWDTHKGEWSILSGKYRIMIGSSSREIVLKGYVSIAKE